MSTLYDLGEVEKEATLECGRIDVFEGGTADELFAGGGGGFGEGLGEDLQVGRDRDGFFLPVPARLWGVGRGGKVGVLPGRDLVGVGGWGRE